MTKILLVEDDKSLREIYGLRLLVEGYEIVSAGDGEEAIAIAIKERPQMIISDVMMPKISGFDLLDLIRSTPELKDVKVMMMTALSSEEQRERGEKLGADRYLVKSQAGIEDLVRTVHEVLADSATALVDAQATHAENVSENPELAAADAVLDGAPTEHVAAAPSNIFMPDEAPVVTPPAVEQTAVATPETVQEPIQTPATEAVAVAEPIQPEKPAETVAPPASQETFEPSQEVVAPANDAPVFPVSQPVPGSAPVTDHPQPTPGRGERKLEPLSDLSKPAVDMNALLDKEAAKDIAAANTFDQFPAETTDKELNDIQAQIQQFAQSNADDTTAPTEPVADTTRLATDATDSTAAPQFGDPSAFVQPPAEPVTLSTEDDVITPQNETQPATQPAAVPTQPPTIQL